MLIVEPRNRLPEIAINGALFAGALLIRLAAIWIWRFDGLYGQDAFAYYQQALAIAERAPQGLLPPTDFFWPNGYPLLAALFMGLLGRSELAAQLVNLLCGAALSPLVYALSRDLFPKIGRRAGVWAGLIVAVAGQPILSSIVIMADIPALFWATLAAWWLVRAWQPPSVRAGFLLLAGLALGLAAATRWVYVLLALPFAAYALAQTGRRQWRSLLLPVVGGLSVLLPQVWLSLNRPESLLHSWLLNWRISNGWGRQFAHIDGDYTYPLPVGIYYLQPLAHPNYMLPVLGLAALWGMWHLWRSRAWAALVLLGGWFGVVYLFLAGIPYENFRFGLTLYLPAVLLAGLGVERLRAAPPVKIERRMWERAVHIVVVASLLGMGLWAVRSMDRFLSAQNQSKATAQAVARIPPANASVLAFGLTLTLQHYTDLHVVEFYNLNPETLDAATTSAAPVYLLVDPVNIAQQWQERPPAINYQWLQAHRMLTRLADFPPYSLFQITGGVGL